MDKLYLKLEQAKKEYELNKKQKAERYTEIMKAISLTDRVVLRTYSLQNQTINMFQKNIVLSKLKNKYYILHDANDPSYFCIDRSFKVTGDFATIMQMYILIPKYEKNTPLCLFIRREAKQRIMFSANNKKCLPTLNCFTDLYYEHGVYAYLSDYNFEEVLSCALQARGIYYKFNWKMEIKKFNYLESVKKYIKENYLKKTFTFDIYENKEFSKYIHYPEKYGLGEFDSLLSIALKGIYEKFKKEKRSFESFISIGKYEIKYKANTCIQNVRVEISDNTKKTRKHLGNMEIDSEILQVVVEIYEDNVIVNERIIYLCEARRFEDILGNYIKDFYIH